MIDMKNVKATTLNGQSVKNIKRNGVQIWPYVEPVLPYLDFNGATFFEDYTLGPCLRLATGKEYSIPNHRFKIHCKAKVVKGEGYSDYSINWNYSSINFQMFNGDEYDYTRQYDMQIVKQTEPTYDTWQDKLFTQSYKDGAYTGKIIAFYAYLTSSDTTLLWDIEVVDDNTCKLVYYWEDPTTYERGRKALEVYVTQAYIEEY